MCNGLPKVVLQYFDYVTGLKFEDKPDYNYIKKLFSNHLVSLGLEQDIYFDWLLKKMGKSINPKDYAGYEEGISSNKSMQRKMSTKKKMSNANLFDLKEKDDDK